jgi:hypothetical protein
MNSSKLLPKKTNLNATQIKKKKRQNKSQRKRKRSLKIADSFFTREEVTKSKLTITPFNCLMKTKKKKKNSVFTLINREDTNYTNW